MASVALSLPISVSHRDHSGLFAIEATVIAWRETSDVPSNVVTLTLGAGTLHDADKGAFPLDGLEVTLRLTDSRPEPLSVSEPGVLSEVQQEVLLDAISCALDATARPPSHMPRSTT